MLHQVGDGGAADHDGEEHAVDDANHFSLLLRGFAED
jgi:hypothetical protein